MDGSRLARVVRVARLKRRLRQADLGGMAGVSQSIVSRLERGRLQGMSLKAMERVAHELGIRVVLDARWEGGDAARLADAGHASLVEFVVRALRTAGWTAVPEYTFSRYGERGSVDVLGWHGGRRALLMVEVKTRILDLQDLLAVFDRKCRVVPVEVARERGWVPTALGRLLVVADTAANRAVVRKHHETFDSTFPARSREARAWISDPARPLAAVWFVSRMRNATSYYDLGSCRRVRRPLTGPKSGGGGPRRSSGEPE